MKSTVEFYRVCGKVIPYNIPHGQMEIDMQFISDIPLETIEKWVKDMQDWLNSVVDDGRVQNYALVVQQSQMAGGVKLHYDEAKLPSLQAVFASYMKNLFSEGVKFLQFAHNQENDGVEVDLRGDEEEVTKGIDKVLDQIPKSSLL